MDERSIIKRVSIVGIAGNIVLVAFKLTAGIIGKSGAMVSDAIHSASDVLATFIALIGVVMAKKEPDEDHPYGHDRFECLASLVLGVILAATSFLIGYRAIMTIVSKSAAEIESPSAIALIAAVVSIATKEAMFWYTRHYARAISSSAFMADAWHHRSDALSSVGSLIGIGGAMLGIRILDPIASIAICICILKVGYDILRDAVDKMIDTSCGPEYENELSEFISSCEGVCKVDSVHTRKFGNKVYIDSEISVDGNLTLFEAHDIAQRVHDAVESKYSDTKHIMIHENPIGGI